MATVTVYPWPLDSATKPNRRNPSSTPRRAEHTPVNFSDIVNSLLATTEGKGAALIYAYFFG